MAQGLDEAQVTSFVNDLLNQYNSLLQEHEAVGSVRGFSKQMLEDAERQVASVRARGKRDAELEAARILSEAQQQATQTLSQAKRRAEEITGQEVRDLIQAAQLRAELVERQSKIQAQKFFLQVRDEVQGQITNEVQAAYYKLLSALQELSTAGQSIETEWKSKTYQLLSAAPLELEEYQSHFLDTFMAETRTPTGSPGELGSKYPEEGPSPSTMAEDTLNPPLADLVDPFTPKLVEEEPGPPMRPSPGSPEARSSVTPVERSQGPTAMRRSDEMDVLERMAQGKPIVVPQGVHPEDEALPHRHDEPHQVAPHRPSVGLLSPVSTHEEPHVEQPEAAPGKEAPVVQPSQKRGGPDDADDAIGEVPPVARDRLYTGEVDLIMGPSVDFQLVAKFYSHLQTLRGLQILRTTGDWNVGTVVTVMLDTPTALISLLESIPSVRATPDSRDTGALWPGAQSEGGKGEKRARITLTVEGDR
ncbi:MAG: hypothetical protein HY685_02675 [Chloroflexi bacterium]|nr:hypothetical protein [Chloroflexota bacterium]